MNNKDLNIQMRLLSVEEVMFAMFPERLEAMKDPMDLQIGFMSRLIPESESDKISVIFGVKYVLLEETLLECQYRFCFEVKDLNSFLKKDKDNNIVLEHLMPHFLSVAVGTMRGIIVVKTAGTSISKFPLPMIDLEDLCSNLLTKEVGQ